MLFQATMGQRPPLERMTILAKPKSPLPISLIAIRKVSQTISNLFIGSSIIIRHQWVKLDVGHIAMMRIQSIRSGKMGSPVQLPWNA